MADTFLFLGDGGDRDGYAWNKHLQETATSAARSGLITGEVGVRIHL